MGFCLIFLFSRCNYTACCTTLRTPLSFQIAPAVKLVLLVGRLAKNALIAVFTNGLHSRSPFEKENSNRKVVFMHYGAFDKVSLFKYSNYNKNK